MFRKMYAKRFVRAGGVTLVELMVCILILSIVMLGTMVYQYSSIQQTHMAQGQMEATRIAQLLIEDWKASGAVFDYDPEKLQLDIVSVGGTRFDAVGNMYKTYQTPKNNPIMRIDLLRPTARSIPIPISVTVYWDLSQNILQLSPNCPSVVLATYARGDEMIKGS